MRVSAPGADEFAAVIRDPVRFCRALLRQDVWSRQEAILRALSTERRVAVKACHASGKTFIAASAVLWFLSRYPDAIVVTTAPTWTQVEQVLWSEIHKAVQQSRIAFPVVNKTELRVGPGNFAIGLSTNEGVRFQGFHGRVLIVVDEAPGVAADIWEAIEGIRAGGDVRVLALGNPTIASGPFYDAFTANRGGWATFTISAFDSPILQGLTHEELLALPEDELDRALRPYLVTRRWVREKYAEWGPGHPLWEARVLGQFPRQAEDALISLAWLEAASLRTESDERGPLCAGLDVGGPWRRRDGPGGPRGLAYRLAALLDEVRPAGRGRGRPGALPRPARDRERRCRGHRLLPGQAPRGPRLPGAAHQRWGGLK